MKLTRTCLKIGVPSGILMYFLVVFTLLHRIDTDLLLHSATADTKQHEIEPCTFQQLYSSFPPRNPSKRTSEVRINNKQCWKLEDEIVRVPATAVLNRNTLESLGSGKLGGVHKAHLQLNYLDGINVVCAVAIKTDHCQSWFPYFLHWQRQRSCLEDASVQHHPWSYTGAEYTGALVWYAQLLQNKTIPGLLPTWGVVTDVEHPVSSPGVPFEQFGRFPHTDATIKGVIMPLEIFTPVSSILKKAGTTSTTATLAARMLPAARGLEFVGSLGLAFRDLLEKNVAWAPNNSSIVYDHSFMGLQRVDHCRATSCNFCHEKAFPPFDDEFHHGIKGIPLGHPYILGDMHNFRNVVIKLISNLLPSRTALAEQMATDLRKTVDVNDLIRVLQRYATSTTDEI